MQNDTFIFDADSNAVFCEPLERMRLTSIAENGASSNFYWMLLPLALIDTGEFSPFCSLILALVSVYMFEEATEMITVVCLSLLQAGIVLGPTCLGRIDVFNTNVFTPRNIMALNVFEALGVFYIFFLVSIQTDMSILKRSGRLAVIIGIGTYVIPLIVTTVSAFIIRNSFELDESVRHSLPTAASLQPTISFHVIILFLTELKLLNSELGRLALSSALINSSVGLLLFIIGDYAKESSHLTARDIVLMNLSDVIIVISIFFGARQLVLWMMKQTPEGAPLKHDYILAINIILLLVYFFGEISGKHALMGAVILGMVIPHSPPMGSRLATRIHYVVWAVFMPCYLLNIGRNINLFDVKLHSFIVTEFLITESTVVKFFVALIPSLYYKIPFMDAVSLGLVLNCRGIHDMPVFTRARHLEHITEEMFTVITVSAMLQTAIIVPLVRSFYDSSRRYVAYRRRTIQHNQLFAELRILVCVNELDNVPTLVNILYASNPPQSPVGIYVMNLEEYTGRSMPMVMPHRLEEKSYSTSKTTIVDTMVNAFHNFEQQGEGYLSVQCFTAIAPYASMHDDVCSMAFEKDICLVIIPFVKTDSLLFVKVIKQVLKLAPCSIGIFFDRGIFMDSRPLFSRKGSVAVHVCVIFVGGADDREALVYSQRMAENTKIFVTVIRIVPLHCSTADLIEENHDLDMINSFRVNTMKHKNSGYIERSVAEGADTAKVLNNLGNDFDLFLVGRRHDENTPVLSGLSEWNEYEELGINW
ncbi:hypothetical protein Pint_34975 [Pistacia integerrima]|uniref:Uncharacterized protein n=1 Tax=Pistacia integerrima TaxID=434235 RepID=A0ACC0Y223_9ROSI|nr:hypothetical protein Pint_34975 [Pistacia integerrima]